MSTIENSILEYNSKANNVIEEIKERLKSLHKILEEPEYKYKEHCNFLRDQVQTISKGAIDEINNCKEKFFTEIDYYELKCQHRAEQEQVKKMYIQELINKSNEKLLKWQAFMDNADRVEKSLASLNLNGTESNVQL